MQSVGYSCRFLKIDSNILDRFTKNIQISVFVKIRPVRAELFHADGGMDGHKESCNRLWQFCENA